MFGDVELKCDDFELNTYSEGLKISNFEGFYLIFSGQGSGVTL